MFDPLEFNQRYKGQDAIDEIQNKLGRSSYWKFLHSQLHNLIFNQRHVILSFSLQTVKLQSSFFHINYCSLFNILYTLNDNLIFDRHYDQAQQESLVLSFSYSCNHGINKINFLPAGTRDIRNLTISEISKEWQHLDIFLSKCERT